jgi:hypothetical protein
VRDAALVLIADPELLSLIGAGDGGSLARIDLAGALGSEDDDVVVLAADSIAGDGAVLEVLLGRERGWFAVVRSVSDRTFVEARTFAAAHESVAAIEVAPDLHTVVHGDRGALACLPDVVSLGEGELGAVAWVLSMSAQARRVAVRDSSLLAAVTEGFEEYGLEASVLPVVNRVAIQSRKAGDRFGVWDATSGVVAADVHLRSAWPMKFADRLSPPGMLWAASFDTLYEFDVANWELRRSFRLRGESTGHHAGWLRVLGDGSRLLVGWDCVTPRRITPDEPWTFNEPACGEVLVFDVAREELKRIATFPGWTGTATFLDAERVVVAQAWTRPATFWATRAIDESRTLHPPRDADDRMWL